VIELADSPAIHFYFFSGIIAAAVLCLCPDMKTASLLLVAAIFGGAEFVRAEADAGKSIHLAPVGTTVRGSFVVVGKVVPLPEGEFVLAATKIREATTEGRGRPAHRPKMVDVYLAQMEGRRIRATVVAYTLLETGSDAKGGRWVDEPCRRTDTLFRLDLAEGRADQTNCLLVNHFVNTMSSSDTGIYADAVAWLTQRGMESPVAALIDAQITYIQADEEILMVRYAFNPEAFACDSPRSASWDASPWHRSAIEKDPEKVRFVDSIVEWGKSVQRQVTDAMEGRPAALQTPGRTPPLIAIHRCGSRGG
jgi:hypothetical protein